MARAVFAISVKKFASKKTWETCQQSYRDLVLAEVDAALDALTANPGEAVLQAGANAGIDEFVTDEHAVDLAGQAFQAMIRAIKEGK